MSEDTPVVLLYWSLLSDWLITKSPWTLSNTNSLVSPTVATVSLAPDPEPVVVIPNTSPTLYPEPPSEIVAPVISPAESVTSAFAPLPLPVIVVKLISSNVVALASYPDPASVIFNVPVTVAAVPTSVAAALVLSW